MRTSLVIGPECHVIKEITDTISLDLKSSLCPGRRFISYTVVKKRNLTAPELQINFCLYQKRGIATTKLDSRTNFSLLKISWFSATKSKQILQKNNQLVHQHTRRKLKHRSVNSMHVPLLKRMLKFWTF